MSDWPNRRTVRSGQGFMTSGGTMNPIVRGFKKLADFKGRERRSQFWPYAGVVCAVWFVLQGVVGNLVMFTAMASGDDANFVIAFIGTMVAGVLLLVCLLAAAVSRRLHDRGLSGLWALIPVGLLVAMMSGFGLLFQSLGEEVPTNDPAADMSFVFGFLSVMLGNLLYMASLVTLIVFLCLKGKAGPNRYGLEPA
ncbi:DUF805 domain-containing protein [Brevundimonas sp.]|uniref:DUF805 domain-containing protein n=1 Tax=Brevundimonas sp. TaxID=1871086 RepID=UPI00289F2AC8|nr:DUF805 domain-containing protein [Brevundimonas sp.]